MAAERILRELGAFLNYANDGFKYNLQIFPDTILASSLLFSLLLQSAPLASFGVAIISLSFLHPILARFLQTTLGGTLGSSSDIDLCSGRFPGMSFDNLINKAMTRTFGGLTGKFPSYYSMFLGFIAAYIGSLQFIYEKELSASPKRKAASTAGVIVLGIVILMGLAFRYFSGCDTFFGLFVGLISGFIVGIAAVFFIAWASDRRFTNILGFPLIKERATEGKPIYVCQK